MPRHDDVTGIVLAGGAGRRMGAPKPLLRLGDRALVEHVAAALRPLTARVIVVTNDPSSPAFLGAPTVPDEAPGRGPLMGLYSGLRACDTPFALVAACDAPFLASPLLSALLARRRRGALTLPATARGPQPLPGVYPVGLAPAMAALLEAGRGALRDLMASAEVELLEEAEVAALDPEGRSFRDLDTPEELAAARAELERQG